MTCVTDTLTTGFSLFSETYSNTTGIKPSAATAAAPVIKSLKADIASLPKSSRSSECELAKATFLRFFDLALLAEKSSSESARGILELIVACSNEFHHPATAHSPATPSPLAPTLAEIASKCVVRSSCHLEQVRLRSAISLSAVLSICSAMQEQEAVSNDAVIDDEQFTELSKVCLLLCIDKSAAVRCQGVRLGGLLQDDDAEIQDQLLKSISFDSSAVVRASGISILDLSQHENESPQIQTVIQRVRDVSSNVRLAALAVLQERLSFSKLSPAERVLILRSALTTRCKATRIAGEKLIVCGWLKDCGFSVQKLLEGLEVNYSEEIGEKVVKVCVQGGEGGLAKKLLSKNEINEYESILEKDIESVVEAEKEAQVTCEMALLLRVKCEMIASDTDLTPVKRQTKLDSLLPDTPVICATIQKQLSLHVAAVASSSNDDYTDSHSFVCLQMLKLSRHADFQEETGRRIFLSLIHEMLISSSIPDELVEFCVRSLAVAHQSTLNGEQLYMECIERVIANVSDYDAEDISLDADDAAFRQLRIASVVGVVLEHTKRKGDDSKLEQLSEHILPAIASTDNMVREAGVSCLGKFALLSAQAAEEYKPVLLQIASTKTEVDEVRGQALLAMCDLALLFEGMMAETQTLRDEEETVSLEGLLEFFLDSAVPPMVVIAAEICAKLIMRGRIENKTIMAKLFMIFFDPKFAFKEDAGDKSVLLSIDDSNEEAEAAAEVGCPVRLQQLLSMFFPTFVTKKTSTNLLSFVGEALHEALTLSSSSWCAGCKSGKKQSKRKKADQIGTDKIVAYVSSILEEVSPSAAISQVGTQVMTFLIEYEEKQKHEIDAGLCRDICKGLSGLTAGAGGLTAIEVANLREMFDDVEVVIGDDNKIALKNFIKFSTEVDHCQVAVVSFEKEKENGVEEEGEVTEVDDIEVEIVAAKPTTGNGKAKAKPKAKAPAKKKAAVAEPTKGSRTSARARGKVLGELN